MRNIGQYVLNIVQFQMIRRGISIKVMSQVPIKQKKLLCVLLSTEFQ